MGINFFSFNFYANWITDRNNGTCIHTSRASCIIRHTIRAAYGVADRERTFSFIRNWKMQRRYLEESWRKKITHILLRSYYFYGSAIIV